jgi:Family of unknown function (DUF6247)
MTAQPIHESPAPPRIADTVRSIRQHLPEAQRAAFQDELDTAVDSGDLAALEAVKTRWWAVALIETDPQLKADLAAAERGEMEWLPSPFLGNR